MSGSVRIKICGVTHPDDAQAAVDAGADLIGLNFVSGSPRELDLRGAESIAARVAGQIERVAGYQAQAVGQGFGNQHTTCIKQIPGIRCGIEQGKSPA